MDEQGHDAEVRNPTAVTAETENSIGGADHEEGQQEEEEEDEVTAIAAEVEEEDELIEKAQKLMDSITAGANNPNPTILHALSHILESKESLFVKESEFYSNDRSNHISGNLCNLIRENDEFFELISSNFLTEDTYSTAVKAASVRLLVNCSLTSMYPYVFDDAVMDKFKNWVLDESVKFPGEHSGSKEASDAEMLKTYSTGLLAISLTSRGQLVEDVLASGLSAKLMHYLRVRVIGDSSTSRRDALHTTEAKHVSLKGKEEGRGRVRRVVDTVEGDHVLDADSGREMGQSEGEFEIDGNVSAVVDCKLKPGDDNTGRDDPSRQRMNRSKSRGRGKVNEGATDTDVLLTSPRSSRLGVRDRDLPKNSDVRNAEDVTLCLGKMKSGIVGIERDENDECFQGCWIGTKNITDLVKRAIGAAETEARAAHAPDDAAKAAGDAAAELVKTAALEEFKSSGSEEAAVSAAVRAATTVIDAAEVSRNPTCVISDQTAELNSVETDAIADVGEVSLPDIKSLAQLQEKYCIQCLEILGEYVEVLGPVLHEKGVDVCITLLERTSQLEDSFALSPLLPDVMKLICALAAHRKFAAMFVDRGGLQKLLAVPRVTETFYGLSSCLYTIGSLQGIMERVCALPSDLIHQLVKLAIELLDCSQDQARKNAALFFAAAFVFRAILDAFDAHNSLQKLLAILKDAASVRTGANSDRSAPEVMTSSEKQMAFHTCFALRQYFRAHLLLLVDSIRPSRSGRGGVRNVSNVRAAYKPLDISNEAVDAVFHQLHKDRKLGPTFVRTQWPAVNNFLASSGHVTMLELCQTPPVDRYLHDLLQHAFGVLHIVTSIPDGRKAIVSATLSNNRAGIAVVLDAANISNSIVDPEIIQPALNVLINLVCPPPSLSNKPPLAQNHQPVSGQATARPSTDAAADTQSTGNAPPTPVAPASSGLVGDRRIFLGAGTGSAGLAAKLEQVYRLAREAVRGNDGIKILLKLLQPRIYVNPPAAPDCLRALACRVLLGLARDDTIAQILTKLEVGKSLSELIRDAGGQSSGTDQVRWQAELAQVALELIGILTNSGHANTLTASDATTPTLRRIERAAIAAATPITYDSKELLLLIHEHLQASGLGETASALLKETQLSPLPSLAPPSSVAFSATQEMSAPVVQEQWPSGRANGGFFTSKPKVCAHDEDPNSRCNAAISAKKKHLASSTHETSSTPVAQQQWPSGRASGGFFPSKLKVNTHEEDPSLIGNAAPSAKKKQLTFSPSFSLQPRNQTFPQDAHPQSTQRIDSSSHSDPACADTSDTAAKLVLKSDIDADSQFKTPTFPRKRKLSELKDTDVSVSGKRINLGELGPPSPACRTTASFRRSSTIADASGFQTPASALDVNQSGSSRLGLMTPASQLRLPSDPQPSNTERLTLDSLVVQYLKHQHRQCLAPITTVPPVSLLHPHVCPEPKRLLEAPLNITGEKQILSKKTQDIPIGRIPVMVKSVLCNTTEKGKNGESYRKGECAFDQGGYFVIKGAEKVFIAQEQICTKRLWISNSPWTVSYRSETKRNRFIVRLSENQKAEDFKRKEKVLTVYFLSTEIPVWVLFFALGVASDKEAVDLIAFDGGDASITNSVVASIQEADSVCEDFRHGRNALAYVEQQIKGTKFPPGESVDECLSLYLFPGLKSLKQKARFLGYMVKCLFSAYAGKRKCENRDNFRNKRIELAGELLERELRVHLAHARRTMTKAMQRHLTGDGDLKPIEHYLDASIITNGLSRAFSTGAWCHPFRKMERVSGVVANLGRANPLQSLIDLRRTRQQVLYTGRVGDARYPHPSHWGRVCFLSTPDGENCGLVKNLSLLGLVSTQIMEPVVEELFDSGMEELVDDTSTPLSGKHKVLLNGDWVGVCSDSDYFVAELKSRRRQSELPRQMEIKLDKDDKEVRIFTDAGRLLRPLLVVENLHKLKQSKPSKYTFEHLLDQGILELIGIEEEEDCTTAWGTKQLLKQQKSYTHCELDLSFLLGVSCAIVPFANHDHGRRVLYQSQKHCQQAIGFCSTNPNIRCDTLSQQLFYPQRPLFKTMASECLQKDVLFNGQNAIVAVNVHLGFNQEDSIVMNKASLERGMFRSEQIRSYKADVDSKDSEKRKKMDEVVQFGKTHSKIGRVDSLDDDGFPFVGANMHSGDIVIGRCTESGTDHSVKLKHTERGIVQKVVLSSNDDGKNYATVSLRQVRSPCLGDKFSSMHGQKGVLGYIEEQENFAFTNQGIVPDIVINPHAFPSRQTPGQLLEAALSKGIACPMQKKKGKSDAYSKVTRHATPFSTPSVDDITDQLHRAGFSRSGNERVYNGRTGEMMRSLIFMGPNFYQRLIHMSEDKVKFRNTGPVHPLTRQPVADRKRFGGIKFGEMERDCLIAHGASANLHERLFTLSDSSQMHICRNCKSAANVIERVASSGRRIRGPYCRLCESPDYVVMVNVPYGAKLLYQELFSMGICLNFETNLC